MAKTRFTYGIGNTVKTKKFDGKTIAEALGSSRIQGELGLDPAAVQTFLNGEAVSESKIIEAGSVISFSKTAHDKGFFTSL